MKPNQFITLMAFCLSWALVAGHAPSSHAASRGKADLSGGCFSLKALTAGQSGNQWGYLSKKANGQFTFKQSKLERAEKIYFKATGHGGYLLYTQRGELLTHRLAYLGAQLNPGPVAEWRVVENQGGEGHRLLSASSKLQLAPTAHGPKLVPATGQGIRLVQLKKRQCKIYPELGLHAHPRPQFYRRKNPSAPVVGLVDLHTHLAFPKALAGQAMAGSIFHRYGPAHALGDCGEIHGPKGERDLLGSQYGGGALAKHITQGYPHFPQWPNRTTQTHITAYHRWIERAFLSGVKLMVTHVTGDPQLCQVLRLIHPKSSSKGARCDSHSAVKAQVDYIYQLQDYLDAQSGGKGKGWLEIVTSPQQARRAIAANKMALVLGVEHAHLFECRKNRNYCTRSYIEEQLNQIYALGLRSLFPVHRLDNAFGGARLQSGSVGGWLNLSTKLSSSGLESLSDLVHPSRYLFYAVDGEYWQATTCPEGVKGVESLRNMDEFLSDELAVVSQLAGQVPGVGPVLRKLVRVGFIDKLRPAPFYSDFSRHHRLCNKRGLTQAGRDLILGLIKRGMIIEVDHLSHRAFGQVMEMVKERNYSGVVSSHGWLEDNPSTWRQILEVGGMISGHRGKASETRHTIKKIAREMKKFPFAVGVGLGTDIQGVAVQPAADGSIEISYPFDSYDGMVSFSPPQVGTRKIDYHSEGVAHYGLMAEWLENLRIVDGDGKATRALMNSAEAYLQMWERASASARGQSR